MEMTKKTKFLWLSIVAVMLLAPLSFGGYYVWERYFLPYVAD